MPTVKPKQMSEPAKDVKLIEPTYLDFIIFSSYYLFNNILVVGDYFETNFKTYSQPP